MERGNWGCQDYGLGLHSDVIDITVPNRRHILHNLDFGLLVELMERVRSEFPEC